MREAAAMADMNEAEWRAFVVEGTRTGKLATVRANGRPHVAPVWFVVDDDDGTLVFTTGSATLKGRAIRRDPHVAMCVDDETPPFAFVTIEGPVSISENLDEMLTWATRIGARYMGEAVAERFGRRNAVLGELRVRLRPTKVVAQKGVAD